MALLERLAILITADASGAINEFQKVASSAEADLKKAGNASDNFSGQMTKVGAAMMGAGAGLLAVGVSAASSTTDLGREVLKLQRYTGMTAEQASELAYASKMSGVQVDSLAIGLGKLSKAAEANSPVFQNLGVDVRDSHGNLRSMGELLPEVAEKFKNMPNGPEKTAAALQLFGRSGMDLMPFLNKGSDGIKQLSTEAEKMGLVLNGDNIAAIKNHIQSQRELGAAFDGLKTKIGLEMIPILDGFTNIVKNIPGPVLDIIGPLTVFGGLGLTGAGAIGMLVGQLKNLGPAITAVSTFMAANPLTVAFAAVAVAVGAAIIAIKAFGSETLTNKHDMDSFAKALNETGSALDSSVSAIIATRFESKGLGDAFLSSGISADKFKAAVMSGDKDIAKMASTLEFAHLQAGEVGKKFADASPATRDFVEALVAARDSGSITPDVFRKIGETVGGLSASFGAQKTSMENTAEVSESLTSKTTDLKQAQDSAAGATTNHSEAVKKLNDAIHGALDPFFGFITATQKNQEAQANAAKAAEDVRKAYGELQTALASGNEKEIKDKTDALTEAQKKYQDAQKSSVDTAITYQTSLNTMLDSVKSGKVSFEEATGRIDDMQKSNLISAETAKYFKDKLAELKAAVESLPTSASIKISADTQKAIDKLKAFVGLTSQDSISYGDLMIFSSQYQGDAMGGRIGQGMALGGRPDKPYLVGELGPELFVPDTAGTILTADKTAGMLAPSGGGSTLVNVTINMPEGVDPEAVVKAIRRYERVNGTQWRTAY